MTNSRYEIEIFHKIYGWRMVGRSKKLESAQNRARQAMKIHPNFTGEYKITDRATGAVTIFNEPKAAKTNS